MTVRSGAGRAQGCPNDVVAAPPEAFLHRRARYEDPLTRIHRVRRAMDREKKRLGLSELEWLEYIAKENEKMLVEFRRKHGLPARP